MRRADKGLIRLAFRMAFAYRAAVAVTLIALVLEIFLLRKIWTSVYGASESVDGLSLNTLLVYLTLANLQAFAMSVTVTRSIHMRVRTGVVFFDLVRPTGYLRQVFAFQLGSTAGALTMLLPAIPIAFLTGSISAPADGWAGGGYVVSLLLGYGIGVLLSLLVAMIAFWTMEISGFALFYRLISHFFAGTMIPLTFFTGALRTVADVLPFRYLGYVPAAIYVGDVSGGEMAIALAGQVAWLAALTGAVLLVWSRAHRRLVIQGG